jgi:hypothetical protein
MEAMIAGLAGFLAGWVIRAMQQPMGPPRGCYGIHGPGYQPRPSNGGTPNPPPSEP